MRREWIVDVLADLKAFAEHNGLDATAAGIEDAALVAIAEIASAPGLALRAEVERATLADGPDRGNVADFHAYRGRA